MIWKGEQTFTLDPLAGQIGIIAFLFKNRNEPYLSSKKLSSLIYTISLEIFITIHTESSKIFRVS